jgi:hypothetical protein
VMALSAEHPHLTEEMFERSVLSMVSQTVSPSMSVCILDSHQGCCAHHE